LSNPQTNHRPAAAKAVTRRGVTGRLVGVIVSPRNTFATVAADPRWLGMLVVVTLITTLSWAALLMTESGQQAALDQQESTLESFGVTITDEEYAEMQAAMPTTAYRRVAMIAGGVPLLTLAVAGILFAVFKSSAGARPSFRQVLAIVAASGAIVALKQLLGAPINYARESLSSPTNLTVFLPSLDEGTFFARALGLIDLFYVWWLIVLAIGLGILYKRPTGFVAVRLVAVYAVAALSVASLMGLFGGS
jgi:hypothetical protein